MKLEEAMKKATPRPWRLNSESTPVRVLSRRSAAGNSYICTVFVNPDDSEEGKVNAALIPHWYNVGPKLVEALEIAANTMDEVCSCGECGGCQFNDKIKTLVAEAEEVKGV